MQFRTPAGMSFEIPDEWWACADMNKFSKGENQSYSCWPGSQKVDIVPLAEIEPPQRGDGIPPFKKYKLVPILFGFQSPESPLPPVEVLRQEPPTQYRFKVFNGYHRYYASIAVGYLSLPVFVMESAP
jgi:hypothetical protein